MFPQEVGPADFCQEPAKGFLTNAQIVLDPRSEGWGGEPSTQGRGGRRVTAAKVTAGRVRAARVMAAKVTAGKGIVWHKSPAQPSQPASKHAQSVHPKQQAPPVSQPASKPSPARNHGRKDCASQPASQKASQAANQTGQASPASNLARGSRQHHVSNPPDTDVQTSVAWYLLTSAFGVLNKSVRSYINLP